MAGSLVNQGLQNLLKFGRRIPLNKTAIDTVTNPNTYRGFANSVDDVLQRTLPGKFRGSANLLRRGLKAGGVPVLGGLTDVGMRIADGEDPAEASLRAAFGTGGGYLGGLLGTGAGALTGPIAPVAAPTLAIGGNLAGYNAGVDLFDQIMQANPSQGAAPSASDMMSGRRAPTPKPKPGTQDNRPDQGADLDMDAIRREVARAQALNSYVETPVLGAPPNTPNVIPNTPIPVTLGSAARPYAPSDQAGNIGGTYGNGTSTMPNANPANTVLPPNAEQILQADPMQIYNQARVAAQGMDKSQMDKVRNLGLAIHRQKYSNLYPTDNSLPGSMAAKDENNQMREIEPSQIDQRLLDIYSGDTPVLDPNKFLQAQMIGRVAR